MAKIIRPNLVNTVRSSQMSTVLRWGGVFVALLLAALLLLLAEWYLPAAGCMLAIPLLFPLAKKRVSVIRAGADGEAETLRLLRKLPPDWTVIPDAVIEYRDHRSQTDYILVAPTGILILEAKNVSGRVTGRAEDGSSPSTSPPGAAAGRAEADVQPPFAGQGPPDHPCRTFCGQRGSALRCVPPSTLPIPMPRCRSAAAGMCSPPGTASRWISRCAAC